MIDRRSHTLLVAIALACLLLGPVAASFMRGPWGAPLFGLSWATAAGCVALVVRSSTRGGGRTDQPRRRGGRPG